MVEGNFDQYPILRTGDTPQVNIHFGGLSGHDRFAELGEPPAGPVGPAIGNAILPRHRQAHPLDPHPQARSDLGLRAFRLGGGCLHRHHHRPGPRRRSTAHRDLSRTAKSCFRA